jgi:glycerate-2-kinase
MNDRDLLTEIWKAGIKKVHPDYLVPKIWQEIYQKNGGDYDHYLILGGGKAGAAMAAAFTRSAPPGATWHGTMNVPNDQLKTSDTIPNLSLHPSRPPGGNFPTHEGIIGSKKQMEQARLAKNGTVGICLLSGGASALMPLPAEGISLEDKWITTKILQHLGADIGLLNSTRKHLSAIKGGGLGKAWLDSEAARSGSVLTTFAISDVMGDDPSVIASGPTVPDPSTFESTLKKLADIGATNLLPKAVMARLEKGALGKIDETLKVAHPLLKYILLGNNTMALEACSLHAKNLGIETRIFYSPIVGAIQEATRQISTEIKDTAMKIKGPIVLIWGGECTVSVKQNSGKGGRNQELAIRIGMSLPKEILNKTTVLCAGTDGEDGPTDVAGGFFDLNIITRGHQEGVDFESAIQNHSTYHAHDTIGSHLKTGWTGTNVADISMALIRPL